MMCVRQRDAAPLGAAFLVVGAFESSPTLAPCRAQERRLRNNPSDGTEARRGQTWARRGAAWAKQKQPGAQPDCFQILLPYFSMMFAAT